MTFSIPNLPAGEWAALTAFAGKVFIDFADALPAPPPDAGYWTRFWYTFVQKLASNGESARNGKNGTGKGGGPLQPPPLEQMKPPASEERLTK